VPLFLFSTLLVLTSAVPLFFMYCSGNPASATISIYSTLYFLCSLLLFLVHYRSFFNTSELRHTGCYVCSRDFLLFYEREGEIVVRGYEIVPTLEGPAVFAPGRADKARAPQPQVADTAPRGTHAKVR
jgi:hypothetical protein